MLNCTLSFWNFEYARLFYFFVSRGAFSNLGACWNFEIKIWKSTFYSNYTFFKLDVFWNCTFFKLYVFWKCTFFETFKFRGFLALNLCADHTVSQNLRQPLQTLSTSSTTNELILFSKISNLEVFISFPCLHTRIVFPMPSKGGRSWAVCLHCIGRSPPTCSLIIALSSSLYHCSTVSLFALVSLQCSFIICIIQCCRRKPHKFLYTLECAGVRQDILHMCILYLYTFIFVFVLSYYCAICMILFLYFVFVFHYHCWPSSVVVS